MIGGWPAQWGAPGATAVLMLAAALLLGGWLTPRWQAQADAARQAPHAQRLPAATVPEQATRVLLLPVAGEAGERVAALMRLALRYGVEVERMQQQADRAAALPRLQLSLKARGRYVELRSFVAAALQADPGLALERLQWRRDSADVDELQAELHWTLWQPPATAAAAATLAVAGAP